MLLRRKLEHQPGLRVLRLDAPSRVSQFSSGPGPKLPVQVRRVPPYVRASAVRCTPRALRLLGLGPLGLVPAFRLRDRFAPAAARARLRAGPASATSRVVSKKAR